MSHSDFDELAMIRSASLFHATPTGDTAANQSLRKEFDSMMRRSSKNPEEFWGEIASGLDWFKKWDRVFEGGLPNFRYFVGGESNVCHNLIDRHLRSGADNRLALIWVGEDGAARFLTYRMLYAEVNKFANALKRIGVRKGDTLATFLPNLPETLVSVLACYRLGVIFNTVFSGFSVKALHDRLANYEPKIVVTSDAGYRRGQALPLKEKVDAAIKDSRSVKNVVVVNRGGTQVNMQSGRDVLWEDFTRGCSTECPAERVEANEPGMVVYTSGTTGKPKGVVHSGIGFLVTNFLYTRYHLDHHPNDVLWCTADVGWLTLHIWGIVGALSNGATTLFYEGAVDYPGPARFYEVLEKHRVNKLFTTPTVIRMLMRHGESIYQGLDLSCLEVVTLVGEPFNPEAWHWLFETFGRRKIYVNNTWGQTELAGCPLACGTWVSPMKPGSCGIQLFGAKVLVVDEDGKPVPPNTKGHLVLARPFPMMLRGLWREPDRFISEYFKEFPGYFATHDLAVVDDDGYYWVLGRTDDVIKVAGHRLSTMELESAIMRCKDVAECAVIGMPDSVKGEMPVAFVTLRKGQTGSPELETQIKSAVEDGIGKIALPSHIFFTEVLPKTTSGKIMRRLLKQLVSTGQAAGDVTGLEDPSTVEKVKSVVSAKLSF